jgi:hypothetical protein
MDNDIPTNNTNIHISNYTQNIQNWNKESKCKQRIDESKEDKHRDTICNLEFYWVVNHRFSCFSFWIFTLYITNVWYVQLWVKIVVEYDEKIVNLL